MSDKTIEEMKVAISASLDISGRFNGPHVLTDRQGWTANCCGTSGGCKWCAMDELYRIGAKLPALEPQEAAPQSIRDVCAANLGITDRAAFDAGWDMGAKKREEAAPQATDAWESIKAAQRIANGHAKLTQELIAAPQPNLADRIQAEVTRVVPPPRCVSGQAIMDLQPLFEELFALRECAEMLVALTNAEKRTR